MRKIAIVIGIIVVVIVAAVGIFVATFNPNDYRGTVQTKLEQQLDRKVTLGNMELGLFPLRFRVFNLSIADDPKFGSRAFVQTQELSVSVKLLPLLSKSVQIDSLCARTAECRTDQECAGGLELRHDRPEIAGHGVGPFRSTKALCAPLSIRQRLLLPLQASSNSRWANWQSTTGRSRSLICRTVSRELSTITSTSSLRTFRPTRRSILTLPSTCPAREARKSA